MENELKETTLKHLNLLIEELKNINITGVTFVRQENKVMLIFDKTFLSRTNQQILNAINVVYPNIIVSINDSTNPFDYDNLYGSTTDKMNKKVRPYVPYSFSVQNQSSAAEYFDKFRFTGIELNTDEISARDTQFGYFLEFTNALQEQDVIQYEETDILDAETIHRHEHYLKNGCPDKKTIALCISYNEELTEISNGLKISEDPYLSKTYIAVLNKEASHVNEQHIKLTLERINQNIQDYLRKKLQEDAENPTKKYVSNNSKHVTPRNTRRYSNRINNNMKISFNGNCNDVHQVN